ncbi:MAG: DEAD/DEAH box helicase [Rhodospirillales bacterium]|nr:DEAD/DEAH box helicase [Rhodospirillales bacterium]
MTLEELQSWILSPEGLAYELRILSRYTAARSIGGLSATDSQIQDYRPDWKRLLFAGSVLSASDSPESNEMALAVAQAGLLHSGDRRVAEASATVLTQLANHRAVRLAIDRNVLAEEFDERFGATEQMLLARRELVQSLSPIRGHAITANRFQRSFWDELQRASWVSASAPTACGKTYLVLQWLLNEFAAQRTKLAVFLAPTRALVGEIERELLEISAAYEIAGLRVASLPLAALGDRSRPTILVFTQERLHVFLNAMTQGPSVDITVVDEAHKIGDGLRGVILQDAIERVTRSNPDGRLIFLSPLTVNPEALVEDAPAGLATAVVPNATSTVTQNLIIAEQMPRHSDQWQLLLRQGGVTEPLGVVRLHAKPDTDIKRLSYLALAVGRNQTGTLVYANRPADAEKIAWQIYGALGAPSADVDPELKDLSDFARDTIHPDFQLVELARRGVAFHYGNMPTLLRSEIERLFKDGQIRFLVCTSTLVEGVNLACRTIVARGPKKGQKTPMAPHDFWNLAGRAGRWGQDFSGNIICIDVNRPKLWPHGVPERARYPINRETDVVLTRPQPMLDYLEARSGMQPSAVNPSLEQVTAYLLAWRAREGSFLSAPSAARLPAPYAQALDERLGALLAQIDLPARLISRHPGVSAAALQSLLNYFRSRKKPVEELLPSSPESDDAHPRLVATFHRINQNVYPAFFPASAIPIHALVTVEWMRGLPLGQIIRRRIAYLEKHNRQYKIPVVIRDTMRDVEEVARFRAPKYLAAYLDVLKQHLDETGKSELFPEELRFDLFLEFGVATQTLLSLIGLGLSRTSAVALNEFLADDRLAESAVFEWLQTRRWQTLDVPAIVKREVEIMLARRTPLVAQ